MKLNSRTARKQRGFTIAQMVITLAIIGVVSAFGVLGIQNARAEFRLQNNARLFATYVEKARLDAIRRHAATGQESTIETFGPGTTTYAVSMDFGSGALETRNFNLDSGLNFQTVAKRLSFDWRGRIAEAWVLQIHSDDLQRNLPVDVSGSGDITVGEQHFPDQLIPAVEISEVTGDVDSPATPTPTPTPTATPTPTPDPANPTPTPTATPTPTPTPSNSGNGNGSDGNSGNGSSNPTPTPTPAATATPTPTPVQQCAAIVSPSSLSLSQSDTSKQTGTATFTMTNASGVRFISANLAGNGNSLTLGLSQQRIDGNGSTVLSVTTKNGAGNRGVFVVEVTTDPSCGGTQQLTVSVSN